MRQCSVEEICDGSTSSQTGTSRIPGPWLERRHTEGRHTGLHEGSISVGASVDGWGDPGRARRALLVVTSALVERRLAMAAVGDVNNSVVISCAGWRDVAGGEGVGQRALGVLVAEKGGRGVRHSNSVSRQSSSSKRGCRDPVSYSASTRGQLHPF
jgi:hypothetical protein